MINERNKSDRALWKPTHQNGNTAKLIRKVLEGAESMGAETEFIPLGNKKIIVFMNFKKVHKRR